MQYGFDFGLWTRQIARDLIAQRFGVSLSLASVGGLLARVGLTPQKPLQRAYQRDPEAIACSAAQRKPTRRLPAKPSGTRRMFTSGMNRAFAPMRCSGHDVGRQRSRPR